jgi:hypothetical protein
MPPPRWKERIAISRVGGRRQKTPCRVVAEALYIVHGHISLAPFQCGSRLIRWLDTWSLLPFAVDFCSELHTACERLGELSCFRAGGESADRGPNTCRRGQLARHRATFDEHTIKRLILCNIAHARRLPPGFLRSNLTLDHSRQKSLNRFGARAV